MKAAIIIYPNGRADAYVANYCGKGKDVVKEFSNAALALTYAMCATDLKWNEIPRFTL